MFYFKVSKNNQNSRDFSKKGFTLIELLIVVALLILIFTLTAPFGMEFYEEQVINEESFRLIEILKTAQSSSISGKNDSSWGVRFFEDNYVLFMGNYYDEPGRDTNYDKNFNLHSGVETKGIVEIFFEKGSGYPNIIKSD